MLSQYLYISTACGLGRSQVQAIVDSSARNNLQTGVSGLLIYNGRNFLQLLEGNQGELVPLMVRISHDPRHSGISMLSRKLVERRACPDWEMKWMFVVQNGRERQDFLDAELPQDLDPITREIIYNFAILN